MKLNRLLEQAGREDRGAEDAIVTGFAIDHRKVAPGTVFGQSAARALLVGDESALPLDPVDAHAERLTRLKTAFFETGARMVHMISR